MFENVRIYDGVSDSLSPASNVLVVGPTIRQVSRAGITTSASVEVRHILRHDSTLMPGLIDAHAQMKAAGAAPYHAIPQTHSPG